MSAGTPLRPSRRIMRSAGSFGPALLGQVGSFGALVVPILAQRLEAVALLVVVTAVGGVAALLGSWSFMSVYPSLPTGRSARTAVAAAVQGTALVVLLMLGAAASTAGSFPQLATSLALGGLFAGCQSAYFLSLGFWIRHEGRRRIGQVRLVYGLTNLALASLAMLPAVPDAGLSVATSLSFLVAATATLLGRRGTGALIASIAVRTPPAQTLRWAIRHWRPALAGLLAMIGLQASAVVVLGFVELRAVWAVVLRISGGFGTIGVSILGPRVQAVVARAVRRGDREGALHASRNGLLAGIVLSLCSLATLGAALVHTGALAALDAPALDVLVPLIVFFVVTTTAVSPLSVNLVLLGRQRLNLLISVMRVAVLLPAVVLRQPLAVLALLVLTEGAVQIVQAVASFRGAATVGDRGVRGHDHSSTAIGSSGTR